MSDAQVSPNTRHAQPFGLAAFPLWRGKSTTLPIAAHAVLPSGASGTSSAGLFIPLRFLLASVTVVSICVLDSGIGPNMALRHFSDLFVGRNGSLLSVGRLTVLAVLAYMWYLMILLVPVLCSSVCQLVLMKWAHGMVNFAFRENCL